VAQGTEHGFRNSQVTVIAPTGTISFMMDCDTTGCEPDFSLVKMKQLVGGGWMKIVNEGVSEALRRLGYGEKERMEIVEYVIENMTIEGAPYLKDEHLTIFDCAVASGKGTRSISWKGHVKMVAAIQPFISGAISKTFNMPHETTAEEIADSYMMAWKMGIKAFAVYRDGSKATQPLQTAAQKKNKKDTSSPTETAEAPERLPESWRHRMPATRASETHKFAVAGHEGYMTIGMYEDGTPGELFMRMAKTGSAMGGMLDAFALAISMALQYGVPLKTLVRKFISTRFEPAGFTENPDIRIATSLADYIFRYLALRFLAIDDLEDLGIAVPAAKLATAQAVDNDAVAPGVPAAATTPAAESVVATVASVQPAETPAQPTVLASSTTSHTKAAPKIADTMCRGCGGMMIRTGTCLTCLQCGNSNGGC
jgi:ribonucleoside-diphosphate reductase alpha chain